MAFVWCPLSITAVKFSHENNQFLKVQEKKKQEQDDDDDEEEKRDFHILFFLSFD